MIIEKPESARYLPAGALELRSNGEVVVISIDESYACAAAKFLIENGFKEEVDTQAEIIAEAVNHFRWGLGANNYVAVASSGTRRQICGK